MACVDHKNTLTLVGVGFVNDNNASRNTRAVKEVGRQTDDTLDISLVDDGFPNGRLCVSSEQNAVRQNDSRFTGRFEGFENMQEPSEVPVFFGWFCTVTGESTVVLDSVRPVF